MSIINNNKVCCTLKSNLINGKKYGNLTFIEAMRFKQQMQICNFSSLTNTFKLENGYYYTLEMFQSIGSLNDNEI